MKVVLLGGSYQSGNLGLHALTTSLAAAVLHHAPEAVITVCDYIWREDEVEIATLDGARRLQRVGLNPSRRLWSSTALDRVRFALRHGLGHGVTSRALKGADLVLDLSGGDSFTDLYGDRRFESMCLVKEMVLEAGLPLVLPPQTIGPYGDAAKEERVARILGEARQVWARDEASRARADGLLESAGLAPSCRLGVDLAFALPSTKGLLTRAVALAATGEDVVGVNVSGLMWHRSSADSARLETACDYREVVLRSIERVLVLGASHVLLVPHVLEPRGNPESDQAACEAVMDQLSPGLRSQVSTVPDPYRAEEVKGLMGACSWFVGTRMHATIGALSMGVPTAAMAYSLKFRGVFDTVGMGHRVIELRSASTDDCVHQVEQAYASRREDRLALDGRRRAVAERALQQVGEMLTAAGVEA